VEIDQHFPNPLSHAKSAYNLKKNEQNLERNVQRKEDHNGAGATGQNPSIENEEMQIGSTV
jgi:hypothetical protein